MDVSDSVFRGKEEGEGGLLRVHWRFCIANKLPSDADAGGLLITL